MLDLMSNAVNACYKSMLRLIRKADKPLASKITICLSAFLSRTAVCSFCLNKSAHD